jgi:hypothetical protein
MEHIDELNLDDPSSKDASSSCQENFTRSKSNNSDQEVKDRDKSGSNSDSSSDSADSDQFDESLKSNSKKRIKSRTTVDKKEEEKKYDISTAKLKAIKEISGRGVSRISKISEDKNIELDLELDGEEMKIVLSKDELSIRLKELTNLPLSADLINALHLDFDRFSELFILEFDRIKEILYSEQTNRNFLSILNYDDKGKEEEGKENQEEGNENENDQKENEEEENEEEECEEVENEEEKKFENDMSKVESIKIPILKDEKIEIAYFDNGWLFIKADYKKDFEWITEFKVGKLKKKDDDYVYTFNNSLGLNLESDFIKKIISAVLEYIDVAEVAISNLQLANWNKNLLLVNEIIQKLSKGERLFDTLHLNFDALRGNKKTILGEQNILLIFEFCSSKARWFTIENLEVNNYFLKNSLQTFRNWKSLTFFKWLLQIFEDEDTKSYKKIKSQAKELQRESREEDEPKIEEIVFKKCKMKDGAQNMINIQKDRLKRKVRKFNKRIIQTEEEEKEYSQKIEMCQDSLSGKKKGEKINGIMYCIIQIRLAFILSKLRRIVFENTGNYSEKDIRKVRKKSLEYRMGEIDIFYNGKKY